MRERGKGEGGRGRERERESNLLSAAGSAAPNALYNAMIYPLRSISVCFPSSQTFSASLPFPLLRSCSLRILLLPSVSFVVRIFVCIILFYINLVKLVGRNALVSRFVVNILYCISLIYSIYILFILYTFIKVKTMHTTHRIMAAFSLV